MPSTGAPAVSPHGDADGDADTHHDVNGNPDPHGEPDSLSDAGESDRCGHTALDLRLAPIVGIAHATTVYAASATVVTR